jgi:hypothetical protein
MAHSGNHEEMIALSHQVLGLVIKQYTVDTADITATL